jgi:hypothetical protein
MAFVDFAALCANSEDKKQNNTGLSLAYTVPIAEGHGQSAKKEKVTGKTNKPVPRHPRHGR